MMGFLITKFVGNRVHEDLLFAEELDLDYLRAKKEETKHECGIHRHHLSQIFTYPSKVKFLLKGSFAILK